MSEIYYTDPRADIPLSEVAQGRASFFRPEYSLVNKMEKLIQKSGIFDIVEKDDQVAVKMHWGTFATTRTIRSIFIRKVVELLNEKGAYVFITESAGLGIGKPRCYGIGRLRAAQVAGYTFETCLAPLIPADGLQGFDHELVKIDGLQLKEVYVAKRIAEADKVISCAHVKGHPRGGIGGAIKNIGVGCVAKPSKYMIHFYDDTPQIDQSKCDKCGKCREVCPAGAITDGYSIIPELCKDYRCLGCNEVCRDKGAIPLRWTGGTDTPIRIADSAKAVIETVGPENMSYLNFVLDVAPVCDCVPYSDLPIVPDIGILAGTDPVAIDKASLDLINQSPIIPTSILTEAVEDKFAAVYAESFQCDPNYIIEAAQKLQLGNPKYSLQKLL
ncbi:MAG: DUF362 domain-containing protein [Candidatus Helarchaeota archaeon]|nr:DUF362 domain-containing protein [Candidatus Helarchaeota archaeon]